MPQIPKTLFILIVLWFSNYGVLSNHGGTRVVIRETDGDQNSKEETLSNNTKSDSNIQHGSTETKAQNG